ncbi:ABC transporter substrate-binding protein [Salinicola acroporae]|uniref:ABC transporter substrate-binding protein n=2 Tax=Salinicola acroporae TaxID=1541440 RepID=A0ABT6I3M7_9GAMM|nr:ABC transporter substrate-binding protein [Salinicola acroporae]MDH4572275.1 ABC transporter substrate-binding protein [Salinicola acroporae]
MTLSLTRRRFLAGTAMAAGATLFPSVTRFGRALAQGDVGEVNATLRVSVDQAAAVLNPLRARVNPEYLLAELLYSGLTRLDAEMLPQPDLAREWQANDELTEWTFTLRDGVTFHDGSPCTAADVAATFGAILDPDVASPAQHNVGPIREVLAQDDVTVLIRLESPYADLPTALAYPDAKIVPKTVIEQDLERLAREAIGTGPFRLVSFEPESRIVVERNPDYYAPDRPKLARVEVLVYPDTTAEGSALIAGDTDLMLALAATEYDRLDDAEDVETLRTPSGQFLNVNMDCSKPPFNDVRVRQALALTVDREAMVAFTANGFGTPGNDTPINAAYPFFAEQEARKPDLARAKALLEEAGYADGLELTLVASDSPPTRTPLAVALREMAAPAGFRIEVQTLAHSTYLDQVWKKVQFYVGFYNMQPTVDAVFSLLYTSNAPWNETRWNNAEFDRIVAEASQTADEARRGELYSRAQRLMHEEVPSVIPVFFDLLAARRERVTGFELNPRGAIQRLDYVGIANGSNDAG